MAKKSKLALIGLLLVLLLPSGAATTISIESLLSEPGVISATPIMIENVTNVGTVDITIFYNQTVVHVTDATNSEFDFMYPVINNSGGYVRIGGMAYGDGLSGDVRLADLMLEAVGDTGETCSLGIIINELKVADPTETTIPADVENGTFGIIDPPEPPANLLNTTGCHWINWTWTTGSNCDFVEVKIDDTWVENCTSSSYNCTCPAHAIRTITLRGYNSSLKKYSAPVSQTTTIPNYPPVAIARSMHRHNNIGSVYECKAIFDASLSNDPDGSITDYQWSFGDGTSGNGELTDHVYASCNWNGTGYEPFNVSLTVSDDLDPLIEDTATIPVNVYIAGDANADGLVNILDSTLVGIKWGNTCTNGWWEDEDEDRADLNNDCRVNILDAVIVGACWGDIV